MSLKGVPRENAETYFRELTSETTASDTGTRHKMSQATALVQLAEQAATFFHDPAFETYAGVTVVLHR
jgi:hypothetical protein